MRRCRQAGRIAIALAAVGTCLAGCGRPADQPQRPAAEKPAPGSTQPAEAKPISPSALPQIDVTLTCPEQVDVGQEFTAEVQVKNQGAAALSGLVVNVRFDSGLVVTETPTEGDSQVISTPVAELEPAQVLPLGVKLRATKGGTFSQTVEVLQGAQVVASQWNTVQAAGQGEVAEDDEPPASRPDGPPPGPDLGPPLVDKPDALQKLHPAYPVWFDKSSKSVVIVGAVCQRQAPLELFACLKGSKEHESVVAVATKAYVVHAGLMAAGAEPGGPARFVPEYVPPRGPEVEVRVVWKDEQGKKHSARAQDWVRNMQTGEAMSSPWVFAGSRFHEDETTGKRYYVGDINGDLICVANFPSAVLDVPVESSDSDAALMFDAFTERIPPRGTPVTLVLTPKPPVAEEPGRQSPSPAKEPPEVPKPQDG